MDAKVRQKTLRMLSNGVHVLTSRTAYALLLLCAALPLQATAAVAPTSPSMRSM